MLLVTALFGGLMLLSVESRRRTVAVLLIGCIAILGISPPPAQAQLPFCLPCVIQAVLNTITVTIGGWLTSINVVLGKLFSLFTQTVWPLAKINLAKSQIQSIIARFLGVIQSIMSINPHTATLPHPIALESVIRDRSAADLSSVPPAYVNTFRAVPQAGNIAPQDRDLTDMDDAMAQDNLMMLKESDQSQDLQLQLANQIESLVGNPRHQHIGAGFVVADYGGSRGRPDPEPGGDAEDAGSHVAARSGTRRTRQRHPKTQCRLRRTTANGHD